MEQYNEKEIIVLLQDPARQKEAFECVVKEYSETIYWQIRRIVLSHEDANDILQNTFIKAWTNIDYFRGDAHISTWLYRIAFNECMNFQNHKQLEGQISLDEMDSDIFNKLESDPYFNGDELQKEFLKAVHRLPQKQQMVFNMKYFKGMKYEEMSEVFGVTVGGLKASYHHAVKKIEAFLKKHI